MAVVQISRIQIRRGQKNQGTGMPQLASGEMAWAIDTQELYIGNGAVSEGSPAVGNTKIITQRDNLLDLVNQYRYKRSSPLIAAPVTRNLEQRLDDRVTNAAYGILANGDNMADELQFAIDNLYITNKISGIESRITLEFLPGRYVIEKTIYLPSYVSIVGAGKDKTIFEYTGSTGPVFRFINDTSTSNVRNYTIGGTTGNYNDSGVYNQQPRHIQLSNFSLKVANTTDVTAFLMESVRDSIFSNILVEGNYDWNTGSDSTNFSAADSSAFNMQAFSSLITCKNNTFNNVEIKRFVGCVYSNFDIINNTWDNCNFKECKFGIRFGEVPSSVVGNSYGARYNIIKNSFFYDIKEEAVFIEKGFGNLSNNNLYTDVGNDGAGNTINADGTSVIRFLDSGNVSSDDLFDRAFSKYVDEQSGAEFLTGLANNFTYKYYPEVEGTSYFSNNATNTLTITASSNQNLFRIPFAGNANIIVKYHLKMATGSQMRRGTLFLAVDDDHNSVFLTEEYDYIGDSGNESRIQFLATFDSVNSCINISCNNSNTSPNNSTFTYVYSVLS